MTLANLHGDAGDLEHEEEIDRRALAIMDHIEDTDSGLYAALLNNLGEIYRANQDYAHAEEFFQRSLAVGTRAARAGQLLHRHGAPEPRHRRARAEGLGRGGGVLPARPLHPGTDRRRGPSRRRPAPEQSGHHLSRAGETCAKSLQTHLRALSIWENAAGPYQQATLLSAGNIAKTYAAAGDMPMRSPTSAGPTRSSRNSWRSTWPFGSERQKLAVRQQHVGAHGPDDFVASARSARQSGRRRAGGARAAAAQGARARRDGRHVRRRAAARRAIRETGSCSTSSRPRRRSWRGSPCGRPDPGRVERAPARDQESRSDARSASKPS